MSNMRRIRRSNGTTLEELRWYYNDVGGALGMRASPMEPGSGHRDWGLGEADDGRPAAEHYVFQAVAKERTIACALARLAEDDERLLRAAHMPVAGAHRFLVCEFAELSNAVVGLYGLTAVKLRALVATVARARMPNETHSTFVDARHAARDTLVGHGRRVEERVREAIGVYQQIKAVVDRERTAERRRMLYVAMRCA